MNSTERAALMVCPCGWEPKPAYSPISPADRRAMLTNHLLEHLAFPDLLKREQEEAANQRYYSNLHAMREKEGR